MGIVYPLRLCCLHGITEPFSMVSVVLFWNQVRYLPSDPFVIRLRTLIITLADLYEGVTSRAYSAFPHEQISSSPPPLPDGKGVQQQTLCRPIEVRPTSSNYLLARTMFLLQTICNAHV